MFSTEDRCSFRIATILPAVAILLGGSIYVFLRTSEPVFFEWARAAGLGSLIDLFRPQQPADGSLLPNWIISLPGWVTYSLPGALWAFAYAMFITGIWARSSHPVKYLWLSTIPLLILGMEILQVPGIVPGTFSFQDLLAGILGAGAGAIVAIIFQKTPYHEGKIQ